MLLALTLALGACSFLTPSDDLIAGPEGSAVPGRDAASDGAQPDGGGVTGCTNACPRSCADLLARTPAPRSGVFQIDPDGPGSAPPFPAYCDLDPSHDGGGWTLLLKIDGTKDTFRNQAPAWTSATPLNPEAPDLDGTEAKLAGFASLSFARVRLGMTVEGTTRWLVTGTAAPSLQALFGGPAVTTAAGRPAWLALVPNALVQTSCDREGVNVVHPVNSMRLGILFDQTASCADPDSMIGVGQRAGPSCGAWANPAVPGGPKTVTAFCYVMVR